MTWSTFFRICHSQKVATFLSYYIVSSWIILQAVAITWEAIGMPAITLTILIILLLLFFPFYIWLIWRYYLKNYFHELEDQSVDTIEKEHAFRKKYFISLSAIAAVCFLISGVVIRNKVVSSRSGPATPVVTTTNVGDKIAVMQFDNNTGDPSLDVIGKMAADWISHGITQNKISKVVSNKIIDEYSRILKEGESTDDPMQTLSEYFNPAKIITGSYYLQNNEVIIESTVFDGKLSGSLFATDQVNCKKTSPLICIESINQSLLGYLITEKGDPSITSAEAPPKFEAYQLVVDAKNENYGNSSYIEMIEKALEIDSNFFEAKVLRLAHYYNDSNYKVADSLLQITSPDSKQNLRQTNLLFLYEALLSGRNNNVFQRTKREFEYAPFDLHTNTTMMVSALQFVNRPELIQDIYDKMESDVSQNYACSSCMEREYILAIANLELGNFEKVYEKLHPIISETHEPDLIKPLVLSLILRKEHLQLSGIMERESKYLDASDYDDLLLFTGIWYMSNNDLENAAKYFEQIIASHPDDCTDNIDCQYAHYYSGNYEGIIDYFESFRAEADSELHKMSYLAIAYHAINQPERTAEIIGLIKSFDRDFTFGSIEYVLARIYAALGDEQQSLKHLKSAVSSGQSFTIYNYKYDPHFKNLKHNADFKKIMNYWHD